MSTKIVKSVIMTYLRVVEQKYVRDVYRCFRLGISDLCYKNRYNEADSLCPMCKTESENETHFLLKCPSYVGIRAHYVPANDGATSLQEHVIYYVKRRT